MTVEEKIYALWSADATATALVPAARFKPGGVYQNLTVPYVIHWPISVTRPRTIGEGAANAIEISTRQFSIYASSMTAAEAIRRKLISVFDGNKGGFNFHFQASRFVDETPDLGVVLVAADFLVTTAD